MAIDQARGDQSAGTIGDGPSVLPQFGGILWHNGRDRLTPDCEGVIFQKTIGHGHLGIEGGDPCMRPHMIESERRHTAIETAECAASNGNRPAI
jgi:hypothetical protein